MVRLVRLAEDEDVEDDVQEEVRVGQKRDLEHSDEKAKKKARVEVKQKGNGKRISISKPNPRGARRRKGGSVEKKKGKKRPQMNERVSMFSGLKKVIPRKDKEIDHEDESEEDVEEGERDEEPEKRGESDEKMQGSAQKDQEKEMNPKKEVGDEEDKENAQETVKLAEKLDNQDKGKTEEPNVKSDEGAVLSIEEIAPSDAVEPGAIRKKETEKPIDENAIERNEKDEGKPKEKRKKISFFGGMRLSGTSKSKGGVGPKGPDLGKSIFTRIRVSKSSSEKESEEKKEGKKVACELAGKAKSSTSEDGSQQGLFAIDWEAGQPVPYRVLAEAFSKAEAITGRLEIQSVLTQVFLAILQTTSEDLLPAVYLCINKLAAAHEGVEIGVGEGILLKALSIGTGRSLASLKKQYQKVGDLGNVAASARTAQRMLFTPPPLTIRKLYSEFKAIAQLSGKNTQAMKTGKIRKLLTAAKGEEAKYIARALQGKLRIHLADKTVIIALASAVTHHAIEKGVLDADGVKITSESSPETSKKRSKKTSEKLSESLKEASARLTSVYNQLPVWDEIVPALVEFGVIDKRISERCKLRPGVPVAPMLAKPTKEVAEVLEKFAETRFTCEYKYDGERAQIHRQADGTINIFSRNAEDLTVKYPDLVDSIPRAIKDTHKDKSFVIDAEAVAYSVEEKRIKPFQDLQSRKRKGVDLSSVKVRVCVFAFDLLYFDGKSLLQSPLSERREKLHSAFEPREGEFMFARGQDSKDPEEIMTLLNESVQVGCEGLMVKALEGTHSTYEPANRSQNWLKVKKDYLDGLGDTLDLVPIGAYHGKGKRSGAFGAFLLACYDREEEEFQTVCKIGTGFSEEELDKISKYYREEENGKRMIDQPKSYYRVPVSKSLVPDVWFEACQVWEVKCADLSVSPAHTGAFGMVDPGKGIGLRFPRFLRIRDDKSVEEATSAEQVVELYSKQSSVSRENGRGGPPR